jgi:hypothetical protein
MLVKVYFICNMHTLHSVCTAKEGPVRIQYKCLAIYVFPEMKMFFPKQNYNVCLTAPALIYL